MSRAPVPPSAISPPNSRRNTALQAGALLVLALAASAASLGNGFTYDDIPLIVENARVHAGAPFWTYLGQDYWPARSDLLYRPVTVWLFAVQWAVSGGAPWLFHAASVLLYAATVLTVFGLGRRMLPTWAAWGAAALFAVHPVHVEAVANVVGQAELHVGLATVLALLVFLDGRLRGTMTLRRRLAIACLALWAALAKEHGLLVAPSLLLAEVFLVPHDESLGQRLRRTGSLWILLAGVVVLVLTLRWAALGELTGGTPAIALRDATALERLWTMLAVAPEWARLLVWPIRLAADYSPQTVERATAFDAAQFLGLSLVLALGAAVWWSRRRLPAMAFGLSLMALWLLPVSNVFFPTGIVLAERTLFLPSVGFVLALGAAVTPAAAFRQPWRLELGAVAVVLLIAAAGWSAARQSVWRDNDRLFRQTILDVPDNYRAYWLWARHLQTEGRIDEAVDALRIARGLYDADPQVLEDLGQLQRERGRCNRAIEPLTRALELDSTRVVARGRLIQCLIRTGAVAEARRVAEVGVALGDSGFARIRWDDSVSVSPRPPALPE